MRGRRLAPAAAFFLVLACGCLEAPPGASVLGSPDARAEGADGSVEADAAIALEEGLVAWYAMNELISADGGSATAPDSTGGGDGACIDPACPQVVAGHIDGAYMFDGTNDEVIVPDRAALHSESGTIAVWVYPTATATMIISKPFGSQVRNSWLLYAPVDGSILFETTEGPFYTDMELVSLSEWVHLAMTWSPTESAMYIDGALRGMGGGGTMFDTNDVVLGADHDYGDQILPMHGMLDDVRIYERVLSDDEIGALAAM